MSCCNWRLKPLDSAEAQQRLGMVLQLEGRLPEAEACFRAALQRDPDYVEALIGLGQVEALRGDVASALKHFETAIEIDPHRPKAHFSLGRLARIAGEDRRRPGGILPRPGSSNRTTPRSACASRPFNWCGISRIRRCRDLTSVVELAPDNGEARDLRGRAHLALRHFPQAIEDFRAAASRFPNRADIYYHLALALEADHKPADALRAAEQALRLAPDFADARGLSQRLALAVAPNGKARPRAKVAGTEAPAAPAR